MALVLVWRRWLTVCAAYLTDARIWTECATYYVQSAYHERRSPLMPLSRSGRSGTPLTAARAVAFDPVVPGAFLLNAEVQPYILA